MPLPTISSIKTLIDKNEFAQALEELEKSKLQLLDEGYTFDSQITSLEEEISKVQNSESSKDNANNLEAIKLNILSELDKLEKAISREHVITLIEKNRVKEALDELNSIIKKNSMTGGNLEKNVILFKRRLSELRDKDLTGIIRQDDRNIESNRIAKGVLDVLDKIIYGEDRVRRLIFKWVIPTSVIGVFIFGLIWFFLNRGGTIDKPEKEVSVSLEDWIFIKDTTDAEHFPIDRTIHKFECTLKFENTGRTDISFNSSRNKDLRIFANRKPNNSTIGIGFGYLVWPFHSGKIYSRERDGNKNIRRHNIGTTDINLLQMQLDTLRKGETIYATFPILTPMNHLGGIYICNATTWKHYNISDELTAPNSLACDKKWNRIQNY